jgi:molybdopterin molybdotransferase
MIPFEKALNLVLDQVNTLRMNEKYIHEISSDVLAEDVIAQKDIPNFSNSAMDGFALRSQEAQHAPVALRITGCIKAGDSPETKLNEGEAAKIMTGAPLPNGADAVVMVEDTEEKGNEVLVKKTIKRGENVRLKGEEIKKGQVGLGKGTTLNPASVGFLASLGRQKVKVYDKPKVSILVTGNELVKPGRELRPGKIWESNSFALNAALAEMHIKAVSFGTVRDNLQDMERKIQAGLTASDILLICGGISVGEYDLVQEILLKLKVKKIFWRVAMKPGKPTFFGTKGKKLIFGLPGNPASVLVTFLEFVRPAILKMMGQSHIILKKEKAILEEEIRKKADRLNFVRGFFNVKNGSVYVRSTGLQNSHILESFSRANCLIVLEKSRKIFKPGERVNIQVLPWK